MLAEPDDEIYRVNPVWLGPPRATLPWRARYVAYGVWMAAFLAIFTIARLVLLLPLTIWVVAWSLVLATVLTRLICRRIDFEKPLSCVLSAFGSELAGPRRHHERARGVVGLSVRVPIRPTRPRPRRGNRRSTGSPTEAHHRERTPR
ncbi:hypothetical protein LWC34_30225 [Kibdelosporangium philippinense]|uniref:Uncharacterized protein n=1 Tax=Kibdelosporangium philippinense TaxID=211113 RepID=A0ABS8ZGW8_9PSEU|nr:hypothetical protein [Kibdelosporangium philippinense]MCE7007073.1 hypothetical protein [Kibdelosporangium philippinense]